MCQEAVCAHDREGEGVCRVGLNSEILHWVVVVALTVQVRADKTPEGEKGAARWCLAGGPRWGD